MRTLFRSLLIIAVSIALSSSLATQAFAFESEDVDYGYLFSQAQSVTPETTKEYVDALNEAFAANPTAFLSALSGQDEEILSHVVYYLVSGNTLDEIYDLRELVFTNISGFECNNIISALDEQIGVREYVLMIEPYLQYENPDAPFSVAIIKRLIDLNITNETYNTDEEFNLIMAMAYDASPIIFVETISEYTQAEIKSLAKCVSSGYIKLDKPMPIVTHDLVSTDRLDIIDLIQTEIACALNPHLETEVISLEPPSVEPMATYVPTIGAMNYITAPLTVGQSETLSITFSESNVAYTRQWYVEIYQVVGSTYTLKKAQTIGISPGATSATVNFVLSFSSPCTFYTHVKVYSAQGDTLLASRTGAYPDSVSAYWHINVDFLSDRNQYGTLRLYNSSGTLLLTADCLGKSASGLPWDVTKGDTPTGTYTGRLSGPDSPASSYGPHKLVAMTGVSGNIATTSRWGIGIHGGGSETTLSATDGCIRVFNSVQWSIQSTLESLINAGHYETGYVYVNETSS